MGWDGLGSGEYSPAPPLGAECPETGQGRKGEITQRGLEPRPLHSTARTLMRLPWRAALLACPVFSALIFNDAMIKTDLGFV